MSNSASKSNVSANVKVPAYKKRSLSGNTIIKKLEPYLMVIPSTLFLLVFSVYPILFLIYISLTNWRIITPDLKFVGFNNFSRLMNDLIFRKAVSNTIIYTASMVVILIILSLILAMWLVKSSRLDQFVQTSVFTPHIISLVSVSMIWLWLMDSRIGLLNSVLNTFGLPSLKWLESSKTALMSIIIVSSWKSLGYYTLILIASLKGIPASILEAATIDGAKGRTMLFKIIVPLLSPQLFLLLIVITMGSFKVFDTIRIMTGGGPAGATEVIATFIYREAFFNMHTGYAAAGGVVLLIITILLSLIYFKLLSKRIYYQ
jgi:sn-glycerol 3-phosphate transport system permease protein